GPSRVFIQLRYVLHRFLLQPYPSPGGIVRISHRGEVVDMHEHHHQTAVPEHAETDNTAELVLSLKDLGCVCCADELEKTIRSLPHVISAQVDFSADRLTVKYHVDMVAEDAIRTAVNASGRCTCDGDEAPPAQRMPLLN